MHPRRPLRLPLATALLIASLTACTPAPRAVDEPRAGAPTGDPTAAHGCAADPTAVFMGDSFTVGAGVDTEACLLYTSDAADE